MSWKPDVCIYHHPCNDGFAAAWVVRQKWLDVEFIPRNYGQPAPDVAGKDVLIVDFSYPANTLKEMGAETIIVLDHHKTAQDDLAKVVTDCRLTADGFETVSPPVIIANFDMDRCGAYMAWEFCFPNTAAPNLIRWIQDRDLWQWQHPETRAVDLYLRSLPYEFDAWDGAMRAIGEGLQSVLAAGEAIERYVDIQLGALLDGVVMVPAFNDSMLSVPIVNAPPVFASDLGHRMLATHGAAPYAVIYWESFGGRTYSLRARKGETDVSEIAKSFGGGGHAAAAGFRVPRP